MPNARFGSAIAVSLFLVLLSLSAGCAGLPGLLRGALSASPSPSASAPAATDDSGEAQEIVGQVGTSQPAPTAPPTAAATATVHLANFAFAPSQVTIAKGGSVTFINDDSMPHSIVPRSGAQFTGSQTFGSGQQVTLTFPQAGAQPYACGLHPSMTGTVTVQEP